MDHYAAMAELVPVDILIIIEEKDLINTAINAPIENTPMEYLFDVYEEFVDRAGEFDNFQCFQCREKILFNWRKMKTHVEKIVSENK